MKFRVMSVAIILAVQPALSQSTPSEARSLVSAPITDVRYDVTFDSSTAQLRNIAVKMTFATRGTGDVLLSLPAWTPGAYEIGNFARYVMDFSATEGSTPAQWDKVDQDTWRVYVRHPGQIVVSFDYRAMTIDNANAWSKPDFAFFNGTNLFLYPEGQGTDYAATVVVHTDLAWRIATGMTQTSPNSFTAQNYHDLVDMPFFVGRFDIDSVQAGGKVMRFASYPSGALPNAARRAVLGQLARVVPPEAAVFGEVPWDSYTVLQISDAEFAAGSASGLEHQNSHLDIVSPLVLGNPLLASLYAHEIFHAWNVKRMRPADMFPYRYDRAQPTPLLWISEGITDYYADLAEVRSGLTTAEQFYGTTTGKIEEVAAAPPTALEDASFSAWIKPIDGTDDIYYPKGSLAGLLLDIIIRDASDNQRSLDTVMREMYQSSWKRGRGFTNDEWWQTVSRAAGGRSLADFESRYVNGRDAFPWDSVLPLGGLRLMVDRTVLPNLGLSSSLDDKGRRVIGIDPVGTGAAAGVKVGDYLISIGGLDVNDPEFGTSFSSKFAGMPPGGTIPLLIRRGTQQMTVNAPARLRTSERRRLVAATNASPKALRVREGLLRGTTRP